MLDGLLMLLLLSVIMGGASFLAGIVPLTLSLSSKKLRLITALGTGILVGTSLIVIIPEGVETLYKSSEASHEHNRRTVYLRSGSMSDAANGDVPHPAAISSTLTPIDPSSGHLSTHSRSAASAGDLQAGQAGQDAYREPHAWVGVSLILGFILMYLIDTLPQSASASSQPQSFPVSLNQFSFNLTSGASQHPTTPPAEISQSQATASRHIDGSRPSSTTIGLVIHAAADGIALGASSTSSSKKLSLIIFLALMVHKAPAAFGLTSVLLKQGLSVRTARLHLTIFSLAAPVGALLTWLAVRLLGATNSGLGNSASSEFATGVLLLFSGGTFLYVAMHTMQAAGATEHAHGQGHDMSDYAGVPMDDPYSSHAPPATRPHGSVLLDTVVTVGGMLLPLLTQVGHAH
ncbi:uncharacterized protein MYCGRDRAFT_108762 [Zymoseptoria tritici IPO323]|uniref:Zinc/iron permease n=1 Tax=Zymoseptoria tritici (strain CBS 115943 / IPO323) TaxID=336722 RepID=F9X7Z6_ZYMTI|nr:uncharacterized protein MYCGRDRAFT_108762 [Zymoseptoria tritici IPO323]EGP88962.1 hypothetical protein MYCGRDRAFT_108762 [Zymoseptoria tritici IPO323]